MIIKRYIILGLSLTLLSTTLVAQQNIDLVSLETIFLSKEGTNKNIYEPSLLLESKVDLMSDDKDFFLNSRRNRYSSLWTFASLNYVYADLVGLMDKNILNQYQIGTVNGVNITPNFLTVAAGFMQVPLANVFLPQVIKNERTLRWVQIVSGTIMTLVQSGTLFVGKPSPYYVLFSAIEIGTTAYITIDAIKWKPKKKIKTFK